MLRSERVTTVTMPWMEIAESLMLEAGIKLSLSYSTRKLSKFSQPDSIFIARAFAVEVDMFCIHNSEYIVIHIQKNEYDVCNFFCGINIIFPFANIARVAF